MRGRLRGGPVRRSRVGGRRPRAARGALCDGGLRAGRPAGGVAGRGGGGAGDAGGRWGVRTGVAAWVGVSRGRGVGGERAVPSHYYITGHDGAAGDFARWARG